MRFAVLGPLLVDDGDGWRGIAGLMPRTLLAALLLDAGTVVSTDHLVEALWGEDPPASARASLHNHVMRLRRGLGAAGGARLRAAPPGYLIEVEPGELDLDDFTRMLAEGRAAARGGRWPQARGALAAGLALWRGDPLADAPGSGGGEYAAQLARLAESHLLALEGRIEADLRLGAHEDSVGELRSLTTRYPLSEVFHGQLMLALYRSDRRAEALEAYQSLRRVLVRELGIEPSASVQHIHHSILTDAPDAAWNPPVPSASGQAPIAASPVSAEPGADPRPDISRARPVRVPSGSSVGVVVPAAAFADPGRLMPEDSRVFTGREAELEQLADLARRAPGGTGAGMAVIGAIDGMAGVGKTALAVRAAHRMRPQFPDGQLFIDLRGYSAGLEPLSAAAALARLLLRVGVPADLIPRDLGERAALYRDRLAGTRTLIVLDNANSTAQVRPLLPEEPGCLVLVTSRKRLIGLDDADSLSLDVLPAPDSAALLHKVAGPDRVSGHHPAVGELAALCGHMPLALRIAASRLRNHRTLRIEDLVARLGEETGRLEQMAPQDAVPSGNGLRAVFELSYVDLPPGERELFRRLGLVPGPNVDAYAAAHLIDEDHRTAERLLESLLDHNLLIQHVSGRYRMHDLVRLYARELAAGDPAAERESALARLMDYYQGTAISADQFLLRSVRTPIPADRGGVADRIPEPAPAVPDWETALAWMRAERENLLAAVRLAHASAWFGRCVWLTAALAAYLDHDGPGQLAESLHRAAVQCARQLGDPFAEAGALRDLAHTRYLAADYVTAGEIYEQALLVSRASGDRHGQAHALAHLGHVRSVDGGYAAVAGLYGESLALYRELGDRLGQADVELALGHLRQSPEDTHSVGTC